MILCERFRCMFTNRCWRNNNNTPTVNLYFHQQKTKQTQLALSRTFAGF